MVSCAESSGFASSALDEIGAGAASAVGIVERGAATAGRAAGVSEGRGDSALTALGAFLLSTSSSLLADARDLAAALVLPVVVPFLEVDFFFAGFGVSESLEEAESASAVFPAFAFAFGVDSSSDDALCFLVFAFGVGDFRGVGEGVFFGFGFWPADFALGVGLGDSSAEADESACALGRVFMESARVPT